MRIFSLTLLLMLSCLVSTSNAAIVTATYTDMDGDILEFSFDDSLGFPNNMVTAISVNAIAVPVVGATTNDLDAIDSLANPQGALNLLFTNGGDRMVITGGFANGGLGVFAPISGPVTLTSVVPEPSGLTLIGMASLVMVARRRRK